MKNVMVATVIGLLAFQAVAMGDLVNLAPSATYSYSEVWPGSPGLWGDSGSQLNDGNMTNLVIANSQEPIAVIFDLGSDKTVSQLTVFSRQNDWGTNGLTGCNFYSSTQAQGKPTGYYWTWNFVTSVSTVNKADTIWTVDTGALSTPITARYIGIVANYLDMYNVVGISEVGIYQVPEPATLVLLLTGLAGLVYRKK